MIVGVLRMNTIKTLTKIYRILQMNSINEINETKRLLFYELQTSLKNPKKISCQTQNQNENTHLKFFFLFKGVVRPF